jgi:hypothetical protein
MIPMKQFIMLMHNDVTMPEVATHWPRYVAQLEQLGALRGGSSFGTGQALRQGTTAPPLSSLVGYMLVAAPDLATAQRYVVGNPTYDAGGTVELRELVED